MSRDPDVEGRRWVDQAAHDLDTAELLVEHGRYPVACFLAQQAAEKALKGILYRDGADIVLGHSVAALCAEVGARYPALGPRCRVWSSLDQHYIPSRYPDALPGGTPADVYTVEQAASATAMSRELLEEIRGLLAEATDR